MRDPRHKGNAHLYLASRLRSALAQWYSDFRYVLKGFSRQENPSPNRRVMWTQDAVIAAMLRHIGDQWTPSMEMSRKEKRPDYERLRNPKIWIWEGRPPKGWSDIGDPDAPLTDENSSIMTWLHMKQALIKCYYRKELMHVWVWDFGGLREIEKVDWPQYEEHKDWMFHYYSFDISDDLGSVFMWSGYDGMGMHGDSLLIMGSGWGIRVTYDPNGGIIMT